MELSAGRLLGGAFSFGKWYRGRKARRQQLAAHWAALEAEIELCSARAHLCRTERVPSALCRLPVDARASALPTILADAKLTAADSQALTQFYECVDEINRGIDALAAVAGDSHWYLRLEHQVEMQRVKHKARRLLQGGVPPLYIEAMATVRRHRKG